jgi:hypothetical protein
MNGESTGGIFLSHGMLSDAFHLLIVSDLYRYSVLLYDFA